MPVRGGARSGLVTAGTAGARPRAVGGHPPRQWVSAFDMAAFAEPVGIINSPGGSGEVHMVADVSLCDLAPDGRAGLAAKNVPLVARVTAGPDGDATLSTARAATAVGVLAPDGRAGTAPKSVTLVAHGSSGPEGRAGTAPKNVPLVALATLTGDGAAATLVTARNVVALASTGVVAWAACSAGVGDPDTVVLTGVDDVSLIDDDTVELLSGDASCPTTDRRPVAFVSAGPHGWADPVTKAVAAIATTGVGYGAGDGAAIVVTARTVIAGDSAAPDGRAIVTTNRQPRALLTAGGVGYVVTARTDRRPAAVAYLGPDGRVLLAATARSTTGRVDGAGDGHASVTVLVILAETGKITRTWVEAARTRHGVHAPDTDVGESTAQTRHGARGRRTTTGEGEAGTVTGT